MGVAFLLILCRNARPCSILRPAQGKPDWTNQIAIRFRTQAALTRQDVTVPKPKPDQKFRGWKVVSAGVVIQGLQSSLILQALGSYLVVLERDFGWSKSLLSAVYSMNRAESALLGPLQGWLLDKYGPRRIARFGAVLVLIGFLGFSQINSVWQFFITFLFISIGAGFSGFLTVTLSIVRWFVQRRARALAIGSMGFALGGACVPLVVLSFNTFGWRWTAAASGVLSAVVLWFLASVLEGIPSDYGQEPDGVPAKPAKRAYVRAEGLTDVHFTAREALRTRAFWMISLGHMSALLVVGAVLAHLALFLTSDSGYGYTLQQASLLAGALPLMQLCGMVLGGWLGDRVNKRLIASLAMLGHSAGLLLLASPFRHVGILVLFVILHGLAWGARGPLMQALRADYFGSSSFGAIMGLSSVIVMMGTVFGPLVAGTLADAYDGNYTTGFVLIALFTACGMFFFVLATPPNQPVRADSTSPNTQPGTQSSAKTGAGAGGGARGGDDGEHETDNKPDDASDSEHKLGEQPAAQPVVSD